MGSAIGTWGRAASFGIPGVVAGLALSWCLGMGFGRPQAVQAQQPARAEGGSTIAFTTPTGTSAQLLYLVDTKAQAFAVYRVDPQKGAVKLEAARPYRWDLKLEYNNLPPDAAAVEAMVSGPAAPAATAKH